MNCLENYQERRRGLRLLIDNGQLSIRKEPWYWFPATIGLKKEFVHKLILKDLSNFNMTEQSEAKKANREKIKKETEDGGKEVGKKGLGSRKVYPAILIEKSVFGLQSP